MEAERIKKGGNVRMNLNMRPETRAKLHCLADLDGRSCSNFMNALIDREFKLKRMEKEESL